MSIKTRFAPSPTGMLHVGNVRTALYCYLLAHSQSDGIFMLRIEDTDQERYSKAGEDAIYETLEVLGLHPDESPKKDLGNGPYIQSQRLPLYQKHLHELPQKGSAYYCFCTSERLDDLRKQQEELKLPPRYDGCCRNIPYEEARARVKAGEKYTIRLKVPQARKIQFQDLVWGRLEWDSKEIDDQVLLKSDGFPTYFGAIVIDDFTMGCTHALRGQDWIPSIPKLVLISEALDMPLPKFLHLPTIVGADRKKLSKRSGDASAIQLLEQGYIPEAILNFIALLGWNPKTNQEIMSLDELIAAFKIEDIHVSNAFFDKDKFNWMNGQHLQKLQADDYYSRLHTYLHRYQNEFFETVFKKQSESFNRAVALEIRSRMQKFEDFIGLTECFYSPFDLDPSLLLSEKMKVVDYTEAKHSLEWILQAIDSIPSESFELEVLKNTIIPRIAEAGLKNGQVLWPTRVALTSQAQSPGAFEMLAILGKDLSRKYILIALEKLVPLT